MPKIVTANKTYEINSMNFSAHEMVHGFTFLLKIQLGKLVDNNDGRHLNKPQQHINGETNLSDYFILVRQSCVRIWRTNSMRAALMAEFSYLSPWDIKLLLNGTPPPPPDTMISKCAGSG